MYALPLDRQKDAYPCGNGKQGKDYPFTEPGITFA